MLARLVSRSGPVLHRLGKLAVRASLCALLFACGEPEPGSDSTREASPVPASIAVSIDLTQPLGCTVLGPGAIDAAAPSSRTWRQDDMQPIDALARLPAKESRLAVRVERTDGTPASARDFRITVTSDERERTLTPELGDGVFDAPLADFDGDVVRVRFEKLRDEPLVWIAPRITGAASSEPAALPPPPAGAERPNIVLYVIDTLRADRMSLYGHARATSPQLEKMALEALVFDSAYANGPSTLVTMPAMFSSQHASMLRAQLRPEGGVAWTLPEQLRRAGYATGGFQSNPWVNPKNGFDRGFDAYEMVAGHYENKEWKSPSAVAVHRRALEWLDATMAHYTMEPERPFFLFVQTMDVHAPYEPPAPFRERFPLLEEPEAPAATRPIRMEIAKLMSGPLVASQAGEEHRNAGRYEGEIAFADDQFAAFVGALAERGLDENTVVFLTADHGEALGNFDDGTYLHGHSLHEELVRVPLVVLAPWLSRHGQRIARPVSVLDLAPTLLDLAGVDVRAEATGRSLLEPDRPSCPRAVQGELTDPPHHKGLVSDGPRPVDEWFVREGRWKLLGGPNGRGLFDLDADPRELEDVRSEHPVLAAYLAEIRRASVALGRAAPDFGESVPLGDSDQRAVDEALRQLGYIE